MKWQTNNQTDEQTKGEEDERKTDEGTEGWSEEGDTKEHQKEGLANIRTDGQAMKKRWKRERTR